MTDRNIIIKGAGKVLLKHRESIGATQQSIATECGILKSDVSRYESVGENSIGVDYDVICLFAKAFKISPALLIEEMMEHLRDKGMKLPYPAECGQSHLSRIKKLHLMRPAGFEVG